MDTSLRIGLRIFVLASCIGLGACGSSGGLSSEHAGPPDLTPYLHQLYLFRSPANANNTVLIVTLNAGAGTDNPSTFAPSQRVRIHSDGSGFYSAALVFDATFGVPDAGSVQAVTLRSGVSVLAQGNTGTNLPVAGGGTFRAGLQDDPFFLHQFGLDAFLDGGIFPWPAATNTYGPNENCLAIVLEVPSNTLGPVNSLLGVWATTDVDGTTNDRRGRPLILDLLIQPVPRGTVTGFTPDSRPLYRANDEPPQDIGLFGAEMPGIFTGFYSRTMVDANALTNLFLPDVLIFQMGNPNGYGVFVTSGTGQGGHFAGTVFGNGRRLRDDVVDILINILTAGAKTTDNVPDDNGTRITDGNMATVAAFPYIGAANP